MTVSGIQTFLLALHLSSLTTLAQWSSPPVLLSAPAGNSRQNENMGRTIIANDTFVHVVWYDQSADGSAIFYQRSDDTGLTWTKNPPVRLSPNPGNDSFALLAISGSYIHVAFERNLNYDTNNTAPSIYKRSRDNGNTWDADVFLGNFTFWPGISATGPYVYVSLNGHATPSNSEVYFRRSSNNGTDWDALVQISNADGRSEDPCIHSAGSSVYIVWNDNRGGTMEVYYRRSTDNGATWGLETALTTVAAPSQTYTPTVFASETSKSVVVGYSEKDGNVNIFRIKTILSGDGGTTFGNPVDHSTPSTSCTEVHPSIVQDNLNIHIIWMTLCSGSNNSILYQLSKDGGATWSDRATIASYSATPALGVPGAPFISVFGPTAHITWDDALNSKGSVYYSRNPTGNPVVTPPSKIPTSVKLTTRTNLANKYLPLHRGLTVTVQFANGSTPFPIPTGTVTFLHNTSTTKQFVQIAGSPVTLDNTGTARISLLDKAGLSGQTGIKAIYSGDDVYAASTLVTSVFFYLFPQNGFYLTNSAFLHSQVTYSGTNWNHANGFGQNITYQGWTPRTNHLPMQCGLSFNLSPANVAPPTNPPALYLGVVGVNYIEKEPPHQTLSKNIFVVKTGVADGVGQRLATFCSNAN